jgi:hypothetical protein
MRTAMLAVALALVAGAAHADPLNCSLTGYTAVAGLNASIADDVLAITWTGEKEADLRLRFAIDRGTPTVREVAIRSQGGRWATLASDLVPEYRVVSGIRRISEQQLDPLRTWGKLITPEKIARDKWHPVPAITPELIEQAKWDPFWDAPLLVPGLQARGAGRGETNPELPRKPEEIRRATATYEARGCDVKTNGARLEITFPGVQLGVFAGRLQYTVYKGTNLIRQEVIATTEEPSVAYKYDTGFTGLPIHRTSRVVWRDRANNWQDYRFGGAANEAPVPLRASNRVVIAEGPAGSIAAFPPPHVFFWAREAETNLGYTWYRKDSASTFSFGIRQAEREDFDVYLANFALYSAPPGTWQRMAGYFYVTARPADATLQSVLAFTHADRFKPLPGYQVMGNHYHSEYAHRLLQHGSLDERLPDFDVLKAAGINILGDVDMARGPRPPATEKIDRLQVIAASFDAARRHSDKNFLIMPGEETSSVTAGLGGHNDLMLSQPVFWLPERAPGQPLVEAHATYGKVYHVGNVNDLMEMTSRENMLVFMAHPRTKGSQGFPDAIRDTAHFRHRDYAGAGWRWGMGLDLSERRLADARVMTLFDEMNNWVADLPTPKYLLAITETQSTDRGEPVRRPHKVPGDDTYGMNPVNYVKLAALPGPDDMTTVIDALRRGDFFATTGEVLIPFYAVQGTGRQRTIVADVEWTFPLEFVEVVWGDGETVDRQIISATDLPPFGRHQFKVPFDAAGKKWVRFAVWDSAGNGALVQPIRLSAETSTASR